MQGSVSPSIRNSVNHAISSPSQLTFLSILLIAASLDESVYHVISTLFRRSQAQLLIRPALARGAGRPERIEFALVPPPAIAPARCPGPTGRPRSSARP